MYISSSVFEANAFTSIPIEAFTVPLCTRGRTERCDDRRTDPLSPHSAGKDEEQEPPRLPLDPPQFG